MGALMTLLLLLSQMIRISYQGTFCEQMSYSVWVPMTGPFMPVQTLPIDLSCLAPHRILLTELSSQR